MRVRTSEKRILGFSLLVQTWSFAYIYSYEFAFCVLHQHLHGYINCIPHGHQRMANSMCCEDSKIVILPNKLPYKLLLRNRSACSERHSLPSRQDTRTSLVTSVSRAGWPSPTVKSVQGDIVNVTIGRAAWEACSATGDLGTNTASALGPTKTTENLDRVGRTQDLPNANWLLTGSPGLYPRNLTLVPNLRCCDFLSCLIIFSFYPEQVSFTIICMCIWLG
jgi:hypothetical protein